MDPVLAHGDLYEDHLLLDESLALTTFDIVALAPETETHYYTELTPDRQACL